jgi:hypothetical protein
MKKLLLISVLLNFVTAAFATLPAYEPFANSVGLFPTGTAYASGMGGWHQTNAQGDFWYEIGNTLSTNLGAYITNFSLSYPGLPASTGNALVLQNASGPGLRMQTASPEIFETANGTKVYYSMMIQLANIANLSSSGDYCWGFNNGSAADQTTQPSDFHGRVYFKKNGTGYQLGIARTSTVAYDPTVHSTNETVFIVGSYEIVTTNSAGIASTTNDICRLWINPSSSTFGTGTPPTENTNTIAFTDADEATAINTFLFADRSTTTPNVLIVDDFRLGTNWAFVTGGAGVKTAPPATATVVYGGTLSLTNKATGSSTLTYSWQFNGVTISGATGNILSIPNVNESNAGTYASIVSTGVGNPVTNTTTVTLSGDPSVVSGPANQNVPTGGSATFSVSAIGTPTLTYAWLENGSPISDGTSGSGTVFSGTQTATLNLSSISAADNNSSFSCEVMNGLGSEVTSTNATLTVQDPVVVSGPNNVTALYQGTANFSVVGAGTAPLSYQWYFNGNQLTDGPSPSGSGATISGSQTANLSVSGVTYMDAGNYYAVIANANQSTATSSGATLTVLDPYIVTQPTPQSAVLGGSATFTVVAAGSPTINYQWYQGPNMLNDDGSTIFGSQTASLTISNITAADAAKYYVILYGPTDVVTNSTTNSLTVITPITATRPLKSLVERAGDHVAFSIGLTGTSPAYQWQFNGVNIPGATKNSISLTNIQTANAGTYTVTVTNLFSTNTQSATLTIINSALLPLASTNLIVVRVGDGAQTLSGATGNTIYLDQYTTNGTYVDTAQIPDESTNQAYGAGSASSVFGSPALLGQGAGADSLNALSLTVSGVNQEYLNFAGYCENYPFFGTDITAGATAGPNWRGLGSVNAMGVYSLAYTNSGLYSGGNHTIRSTVTLDGTNFWTAGQAGSAGLKYVSTVVQSIATGNGIPSITSSLTGTEVVQIVGTNLVFSDSAAASGAGLYATAGTAEPLPSGNAPSALILNEGGQPVDFAFSPDYQTVYIADSQTYQGQFSQAGGIQRWDTNTSSGGYSYSYTLQPVAGLTNGAQGLTVYFPSNIISWGSGVSGAVIYATSVGATTNSLTQTVDTGATSTPTIIATAGVNQALRGVRFGPALVPVAIVSQPQSQTNFPGNSVTFSVAATGTAPIYYQWQFNGTDIPGATQSTFTTNNISVASSGNYTVIVSNLAPSSVTSATAVLTVTASPAVFAYFPPSYVGTVGDHFAFAPVVTGSQPITAQWYLNDTNHPISGATNTTLEFTNIQMSQEGLYLLLVSNPFDTVSGEAVLSVYSAPQPLSSTNLVVARIGDGVQPLSGMTGNTLYLDQYGPNGSYRGSIQIPDEGTGLPYGTGSATSASLPFGSPALLVVGGDVLPANDSGYQAILTRSADGSSINFVGYCQGYPFFGPDVTAGSLGGPNWRGIGSVNAFGSYSLVYTNTGIYASGNHQFHSAVTLDQTNYWTTGEAGSGQSIKYVTPGFEPAGGGGVPSIAGSISGTRVIQIIGGNLVYSDIGASPAGIYAVPGTPEVPTTPELLIAETNSPTDFAASPDGATVYIADNGTFGGSSSPAGGIQRWDTNLVSGGYTYSYTLATGATSTAGARGVAVDFSAQSSWGSGVTGANIYATTAEPTGNRLIQVTDMGASSAATTLVTTGPTNILAGVKFGPTFTAVSIATQPQGQSVAVGDTPMFSVGAAGSAPFSYQWLFNNNPISGANQSTFTITNAQPSNAGNYSVIVSNSNSSVTSAVAVLTVTGGSQPLTFSQPVRLSDGTLQLSGMGTPNTGFHILASSDLTVPISQWTVVTSGTFDGNGQFTYVDTDAPNHATRFYVISVP